MPDELVEFAAADATPEQWARWHGFRRRWHEAGRPGEPYRPDWLEEAELKRPDPFEVNLRFLRIRDGTALTGLALGATSPRSPEYETNRHLVYVSCFTVPEERRRRLAAGWLPKLVEVMDRLGATVATMDTHEEPGHAFLRWLGAEPRYAEGESRLDLRELD